MRGAGRENSDPERAAKTSVCVVGFGAVVIEKDLIVAAIAKERAAEFSDCSGCLHPARGLRIKLAELL